MSGKAFYVRDGEAYAPTGLGVSPWNPSAQNGVALAGLTAHAFAQVPSLQPMVPARLTIDILGPTPMAPLTPRVEVRRQGKRVQLLELELHAQGRAWLRASALRVRRGEGPSGGSPPTRPLPEDAAPHPLTDWCEVRRLQGGFTEPGPGALWLRFVTEVVAGSPLTPFEALAMAADFGTGVAPPAPVKNWTLANVDISLHLARESRGDWLLLDGWNDNGGEGLAVTHTRIGDRQGMIGMAHQTLFLERRPG